MNSYQHHLAEEKAYLREVLSFLRREIASETKAMGDKKTKLISSRKDMWEEGVHFTSDFTRLADMTQYLNEINTQTADYRSSKTQVARYQKMLDSPYFSRVDFVEAGTQDRQKLYIGLANVLDPVTYNIYVHDWRSPISSLFYQYELGPASYQAPIGPIAGEVLLKRQYKIRHGELKYFFDCSLRINDEMLQEVLSRNTSPRMRNIVETIQKEQDLIIRDTNSELLIVQGAAGSGKTSIALHRIAFLLYHGLEEKISSNNIMIISPNSVFNNYISSVLPELGEENVRQTTFDELAGGLLAGKARPESRNSRLESLITEENQSSLVYKRQCLEFKGSRAFLKILDRLIRHHERQGIAFADVYFDGKILFNRSELKSRFLNNQTRRPMAVRLKRLENIILEKVHPRRLERLPRIEAIVQRSEGHDLEIKQFARLLSIKEAKIFINRLHRFTEVDYYAIYQSLFTKPRLFRRLAKGLVLPADLDQMVADTRDRLAQGLVEYEDCAPLVYLKLMVEGTDHLADIRQVVVDEAQDYYPLQYEIFKVLFSDARFTVLGDINQTVEKNPAQSLHDDIAEIIDKKRATRVTLNKSYRSSYEINVFAQKLLNRPAADSGLARHEAMPRLIGQNSADSLAETIIADIKAYQEQGFGSIAIIGKSQREAVQIYDRLRRFTPVQLITAAAGEVAAGVMIIPAYMAKGLEFDVVMIYNANQGHYAGEFDRRLLYIAATRALHRLDVYYTGDKSPLI